MLEDRKKSLRKEVQNEQKQRFSESLDKIKRRQKYYERVRSRSKEQLAAKVDEKTR
jgi:hypothetical protein